MATLNTIPNPQNNPDGQITTNARSARMGDVIVSELHGKYAEQSSRGRGYFGVSASTGIALIVPATTGGHPTLWNPFGSGVNLSIIRLEMSYVSGANAPTAIEWASTFSTGAAVGTGAPIATFTAVAPTPTLVTGLAGNPQGKWAPTVNTFTAAPAFLRPTGLALDTMVAASTNAPFSMIAQYDGDFMIAPGVAISLCSQAATTTALFQVCVVWEEILV